MARHAAVCCLLLIALAPSVARAQATQPGKPNIIFIMADDLAWGELGCYGNDFNETPTLDRLARQGVRFTGAYAAGPTCSPTRASLLTGQYPPRTGITDFLSPEVDKYLEPDRYVTVNEMLAAAGYHAAIIGKWHLDANFKRHPRGPATHGFHEVIGTETSYIADGDYVYPYDKIATFTDGKSGEHLTDRLSAEAVAFIRRNQEQRPRQPFFLYLAHYAPHTALAAPRELVEKYQRKHDARHGRGASRKFDEPQNRAHLGKPDNPYLAAIIEQIDTGVGEIMAALDELGLADETLLIFLSDNGGDGRVANNAHLRMDKTHVWEGGIRVPQIARWPGVVAPDTTCDVPTCTIDFYPTFAEIAGGRLPGNQIIDGLSLVPLLRGGAALPRDTLFWHYPADTAPWPERAGGAVRQGDLKLVEMYFDGRVGLFNLKQDPGERHNLAMQMPDKAAEMYRLLVHWRNEVTGMAPMESDRPNPRTTAPSQ